MASINKVIIVGYLRRDPKMRNLPSAHTIVNIAVATNYRPKDRTTGEEEELVEWHRIALFDRLAEIVTQHLRKGSSVYVDGRLQTRKYADKDGIERYATDIIGVNMQMLIRRPEAVFDRTVAVKLASPLCCCTKCNDIRPVKHMFACVHANRDGTKILVHSVQNRRQGIFMARHLEFDRTEVVAQAVDAFWEAGYESLPAHEIAESMGIAKSSLYNTFGSKRNLFIESVDYYADRQRSKVVACSKNENVSLLLRQMLLDIVSGNDAGRGCLLVNTAAEFGARDSDVRRHVKAGFDGMIEAFATLICTGQEAGQIKDEVNPQQHALLLVAGISGLRVLVKGGYSADELAPVIDNMLAGLLK